MKPARQARAALLAAVLVAAGCASVPHASRERDAEAKRYLTHPNAATIYVYRPDFPSGGASEDTVLHLDGRIIGATLSRTFFRIDTQPGLRVLHGTGPDQGLLRVNVRADEITFVALEVIGGTGHYRVVEPGTARRELERCCVLLENWAPRQRPLLR